MGNGLMSGVNLRGLLAARPTANAFNEGHTYDATDTDYVYRSDGTAWNIYAIKTASGLTNGSVTNAKLADVPQATFKGRQAGAGTGAPQDMTAAQAKTALAIAPGDVTGFDAQVRTSRLDQMAAPTADVSMGGNQLTNVGTPAAGTDAANRDYVDSAVSGGGGLAVFGSSGDGKIIAYDGVTDNRAEWVDDVRTICFEFGDGLNASSVAAGMTAVLGKLPFAVTVTAARIIGDVSGSAVVNIQRATYAAYGTLTNICASAKPTLSSAIKAEDSTLTGWTTALDAGDILVATLESVTTCKKVSVALTVKRRTA